MKTLKTLLLISLLLITLTSCESLKREIKNTQSEFHGLNRKITIYDYNGAVIKTYEGVIDVGANTTGSDEILFDLDGKRTIIKGGIIVIDEL